MSENAGNPAVGVWKGDDRRSVLGAEIPVLQAGTDVRGRPAYANLTATKHKSDMRVAQQVVSSLIDRCTENQEVAPLVARFLDTHWRPYMKGLFEREGDQSEAWRNALRNTLNLIWSLQYKRDDESRRRLYEILPELFHWVHAVLKSQQVAVPEEDLFFAELARLQVSALRSARPKSTGSAAPAAQASTVVESPAPAEQLGNVGNGVAERSDSADRQGSSRPAAVRNATATRPGSEYLKGLVVGTYVEFQSKRATKRVMRLEWISGNGGAYLFRGQGSGDALCLTADRCIQCLRERSAVVLR